MAALTNYLMMVVPLLSSFVELLLFKYGSLSSSNGRRNVNNIDKVNLFHNYHKLYSRILSQKQRRRHRFATPLCEAILETLRHDNNCICGMCCVIAVTSPATCGQWNGLAAL